MSNDNAVDDLGGAADYLRIRAAGLERIAQRLQNPAAVADLQRTAQMFLAEADRLEDPRRNFRRDTASAA